MTQWTVACQASLSINNSWGFLKLTSMESVMPSNHLILCHPLLLLPSIFPSIRVFSNESVLHIRWPKYWSFNFSISLSSEYSGLISFRVDWFYLLAVGDQLSPVWADYRHRPKLKLSLSHHPHQVTGCPTIPYWSNPFVCFWLCLKAWRILVPSPGIEPRPPAVEAWRPNYWTPGNSP